MSKPVKQSDAAKWMAQGIKEHEAFDFHFKSARDHAINAGFFFLSAHQTVEHGAWLNFLSGYSQKISPRTVQFYIQLAVEATEWVKHADPKLVKIAEIQEAARTLVMESPKPLIALCRELGHMRKFGEYDAVKYRASKMLGAGGKQIEFSFAAAATTLDMLTHLGDENFTFEYPEGKDEAEALTELESKLDAALKRVRDVKKNGRPIAA